MVSSITPTRPEINRAFSVAGFTVRTGRSPSWFEVALTTDPGLLKPEARSRRTAMNFFSTRGQGPLPAERGEAVYLVPPDVLSRFAGQERLYYALAVFAAPDRREGTIQSFPPEAAPFIRISRSFTGQALRAMIGVPNRRGDLTSGITGYGTVDADSLVWAGDTATPARAEPVAIAAHAAAGAPVAQHPAVAAQSSYDFPYDDGFGAMPAPLEEEDDDGAAHGIGGPIPDDAVNMGLQAVGLTLTSPEYPQAGRFLPADPGNYSVAHHQRTVDKIVIHITDGGPNIEGTISWFRNPQARVSAHYVVGQDGEVVQMVANNDIAWHANAANGHSIGIEHVASRRRNLFPTSAEYAASAELVRWLCQQYNLPLDRQHIMGHSEADTHTSHSGCPNSVWDWDTYMNLVNPSAAPGSAGSSTSQGMSGTFAVNIQYDVPLIPQPNKTSCWAASMAMLLSFRRQTSYPPEVLAQEVGRDLRTSYGWDMLEAVKDHFGFRVLPQPSNASLYPSPEDWYHWLTNYGPLWITTTGNPSHAIIVSGLSGDLTPAGTTMSILNPWDTSTGFSGDPVDFDPPNRGQVYTQSFADLAQRFGSLGLPDYGNWRILYLPPTTSQGLSMDPAHRQSSHHVRAQTLESQNFDVNWGDVELVGQPNGMSCWAASAAMIVGWRDRVSIDPTEVARGSGHWAAFQAGLNPSHRRDLARAWGLQMEPPQDYSIDGFRRLLKNYGPLWVGVAVPSGHAIVVTGIYGDGTPDGTFVRINDPWPPGQGAKTTESYSQFTREYDNRMTVDPAGNVNVQILHANDTGGRVPDTAARASSLSVVAGQRVSRAMQTITPASTSIPGAILTRVHDARGDISWTLDQLQGLKHPGNDAANPGPPGFQTATVTVPGPRAHTAFGLDAIFADFEMRFQYNGRSLGNITIVNTQVNDAIGASLEVRATINDDAGVYTLPPNPDAVAALNVEFYFRFSKGLVATRIAITDFKLYGNGRYDRRHRWTQSR